jgi:hypothetical protein
MAKKKVMNVADIPAKIEVSVCWYQDEETGEIHFDFDEMADEFEQRLSELDPSVVVMCSVE